MLTKTLFRLALECPVKVHYARDRRYVNSRMDDEFLEALAKGGHQVGALARLMFRASDPDATEVLSRDMQEQAEETRRLLAHDSVTVFEGSAFAADLMVRADVLVKRGPVVDLIEVKAKSWGPSSDSLVGLTARQAPIRPKWETDVYDLAFQHHVLSQAFPELEFRPAFCFVDKSRANSIPDLGAKIRWVGGDDGNMVEIDPDLDITQLEAPLLIQVDAAEAVARTKTWVRPRRDRSDLEFHSLIKDTVASLTAGERPLPEPSNVCKSCEFYCPPSEQSDERRSGWSECMELSLGQSANGQREESIFGFYGQAPIASFLNAGHLWMQDIEEDELQVKSTESGISRSERQRLQWLEVKHGRTDPEILHGPMREEIGSWVFPLHFIDFETAAPALPFHVGMRPYQPILFQFSHHVVEADGQVRHANECLAVDGEESPGIEVVRQLKNAMGSDQGTILHWYPHERTILRSVYEEIEASKPPDAEELIEFLSDVGLDQNCPRRLRDLGKLVDRCVFLPGTGGSSSMKKVLPSMIRRSDKVREKYGQPIYGTATIPSLNFQKKTWVVEENGQPLDPYMLLRPLFTDSLNHDAVNQLERREGEFIANGAAAMMAYSKLRNPRTSAAEHEELRAQLKRYCELDTFAMVIVYEALTEWLSWEAHQSSCP